MFGFDLKQARPRYTFTCMYLGRRIHEEPHVDMSQIARYLIREMSSGSL